MGLPLGEVQVKDLSSCNRTELNALYKLQTGKQPNNRVELSRLRLAAGGEVELATNELELAIPETRALLEGFIEENIEKLASQLPGCTGKCTVFPCSDLKHINCRKPLERLLIDFSSKKKA